MRLALALSLLVALSACRTDKPPVISIICILDGHGGADCAKSDGTNQYLAPSELTGFWATTQVDEANFASWCYKTDPGVVTDGMKRIQDSLKAK